MREHVESSQGSVCTQWMLSRVTVSLSPLLQSRCHWAPLPWAGGRKRGRSIRLPTWGTVISGGRGSAYGVSQNPGFLLSLFKGFKKSFPFCCCRSCSALQVLFCGLAVEAQLLFRELLAALNQSSLDRGPGRATWLWKLQRPKWALGMSAEEIHSANPPSLVPKVTCSLSVSRLARSKFHFYRPFRVQREPSHKAEWPALTMLRSSEGMAPYSAARSLFSSRL